MSNNESASIQLPIRCGQYRRHDGQIVNVTRTDLPKNPDYKYEYPIGCDRTDKNIRFCWTADGWYIGNSKVRRSLDEDLVSRIEQRFKIGDCVIYMDNVFTDNSRTRIKQFDLLEVKTMAVCECGVQCILVDEQLPLESFGVVCLCGRLLPGLTRWLNSDRFIPYNESTKHIANQSVPINQSKDQSMSKVSEAQKNIEAAQKQLCEAQQQLQQVQQEEKATNRKWIPVGGQSDNIAIQYRQECDDAMDLYKVEITSQKKVNGVDGTVNESLFCNKTINIYTASNPEYNTQQKPDRFYVRGSNLKNYNKIIAVSNVQLLNIIRGVVEYNAEGSC